LRNALEDYLTDLNKKTKKQNIINLDTLDYEEEDKYEIGQMSPSVDKPKVSLSFISSGIT